LIFSMMTVITAATSDAARAKLEDYRSYISEEGALVLMSGWTGLDFSKYGPDEPILYSRRDAQTSALEAFTIADPDRVWTVREIAKHAAIGGRGPVVVGSPEEVAEELIAWVEDTDVDGFNLAYAVMPETLAHVAVDPGTGNVELLDCLVVEDVGRIVNPLTLHGQAIGGMVQGLGGAFLEHLVYDASGQLLAGSLADYLIPTATGFPKVRAIALENHRSPSNPLGVKGAGEGAIIPIGGLMANAVANALASFGAMPNQLPLSPARVWHMASAKQSTGSSE
jgi:CO/xanthine dehydrogenase Mo-binding subunit